VKANYKVVNLQTELVVSEHVSKSIANRHIRDMGWNTAIYKIVFAPKLEVGQWYNPRT